MFIWARKYCCATQTEGEVKMCRQRLTMACLSELIYLSVRGHWTVIVWLIWARWSSLSHPKLSPHTNMAGGGRSYLEAVACLSTQERLQILMGEENVKEDGPKKGMHYRWVSHKCLCSYEQLDIKTQKVLGQSESSLLWIVKKLENSVT